jgi:hypothetical protein
VIQLATWDLNNAITLPTTAACTNGNPHWNVNQAGTKDNKLHATVSVTLSNNNSQVDVYSVGNYQWDPCLREQTGQAFRGRISMLTRYLMNNNGVLQIHRVAYMGKIYFRGSPPDVTYNPIPWASPLHQDWLPFLAGAAATGDFDPVAMGFDDSGAPNWWYRWNYNIPTVGFPAWKTFGYSVIYNSTSPSTTTFVAVIFGTKHVIPSCTDCVWNFRMKDGTFPGYGVLALLPELYVNASAVGLTAHLLIQSDILLYPGTALNQTAVNQIRALASTVPAPVIYDPDQTFTGDLATIVSTLKANFNLPLTAAMRTDHLASQITSGH